MSSPRVSISASDMVSTSRLASYPSEEKNTQVTHLREGASDASSSHSGPLSSSPVRGLSGLLGACGADGGFGMTGGTILSRKSHKSHKEGVLVALSVSAAAVATESKMLVDTITRNAIVVSFRSDSSLYSEDCLEWPKRSIFQSTFATCGFSKS